MTNIVRRWATRLVTLEDLLVRYEEEAERGDMVAASNLVRAQGVTARVDRRVEKIDAWVDALQHRANQFVDRIQAKANSAIESMEERAYAREEAIYAAARKAHMEAIVNRRTAAKLKEIVGPA